MRQLKIYSNGVFAGMLTETDARRYEFTYDHKYVESPAPSISVTLPKRVE